MVAWMLVGSMVFSFSSLGFAQEAEPKAHPQVEAQLETQAEAVQPNVEVKVEATTEPKVEPKLEPKLAPKVEAPPAAQPVPQAVCEKFRKDILNTGRAGYASRVTHYFTPSINKYSRYLCSVMEGSCVVTENGRSTLHNYGIKPQSLQSVKNNCVHGYGNRTSPKGQISPCLDPCYTVAADFSEGFKFGQVLYFPKLAGRRCGDGSIHNGCVIVKDVGSAIQGANRFDLFLGRCKDFKNGVCNERKGRLNVQMDGSPYYNVPSKVAKEFIKERNQEFHRLYIKPQIQK